MITIFKHVECCFILHNLLIDDVIPDDWKDFLDDELLDIALKRMWLQTEMFEDEIDLESSQDHDLFIAGKSLLRCYNDDDVDYFYMF
jgi:hypothetical protein